MVKVNTITLRPGNVIEHNEKLMVVLKHEIQQCQQRSGIVQLDLRDLRNGNKNSMSFKTGEIVERVRLDQSPSQFLFAVDDEYTFMDNETFEQTIIRAELLGDDAEFLQEGMEVKIESHEGEAIRVELPPTITAEVAETEPVVKGQTVSSSYKPATLDIGVRVMVPPHIDAGTRIVVKTEDRSYVERAKD